MEIAEIIGVIAAALVLTGPLWLLHNYTPGGIGGANLPAPQAGLMAMMAKGIVGGEMAWPLVIMGGFFALGLILLGGGSPMLVAVGMYLPLYSNVRHVCRWGDQRPLWNGESSEKERGGKNRGG